MVESVAGSGFYRNLIVNYSMKTVAEYIKRGLTKHRFYSKWSGIIARCYNPTSPSYKYYGARGIFVSLEFRNSSAFLQYLDSLPGYGVNNRTYIDRIDNNKGYERGNLRWANMSEQLFNKSLSRHNTSGVNGVYFRRPKNIWVAYIIHNNKWIYIGGFKEKIDAINARNNYDKKIAINDIPHLP